MRHLMSPLDFSVEELDQLMDLASDIEAHPEKYAHACAGKKLATLFYEPSTRTRLSHEAAMMNLGGNVLGFSSAASSSATKGESVADTIRMVSCYADICAIRHPKEGAPMVAAQHSSIPVINAGDVYKRQAYSLQTAACVVSWSSIIFLAAIEVLATLICCQVPCSSRKWDVCISPCGCEYTLSMLESVVPFTPASICLIGRTVSPTM